MKNLLLILLCACSLFAKSQDRIVMLSDTVDCVIEGVDARGVQFTYDGNSRVAALDIVSAILFRGKWMKNTAIRQLAAENLPASAGSNPESVVKNLKYLENTVPYHIDQAGKLISGSVLVMVACGIVSGLVAKNNPDVAIGIAVVGGIGGTIGLVFAGSELRAAAREMSLGN